MKFSQKERGINNFSAASRADKKFNRVFHPVSTTTPVRYKMITLLFSLHIYYLIKFLNLWENYGPGWLNDLLNLRVYPP